MWPVSDVQHVLHYHQVQQWLDPATQFITLYEYSVVNSVPRSRETTIHGSLNIQPLSYSKNVLSTVHILTARAGACVC